MVKISSKNIFKSKKAVPLYILIVLLVLWFIISGLFGAKDINNKESKSLNIESGSSTTSIANTLEKEGVISNALVYKTYIRVKGHEGALKAGNYKLSPSMTMEEITDILSKGQTNTISVTIPEGYTLDETIAVLEKKSSIDKEEFLNVIENKNFPQFEFLKDLPEGENRLEGFLFPDTYKITESMSAEQIISLMLSRFEDVYNNLPESETNLSPYESIILASIVEKEAVVEEERPIIASVFLNRLNIDMRLQSCATLQYLFPERKVKIYTSDQEIESPYNTYKNTGLPKGPICSPGESSLIAAYKPAKTDYFYFVAKQDGSGGHLFSTTHDEHVKNKNKLGY